MDNGHREENTSYSPLIRVWLCGTFRVERRVGSGYELVRTTEWGGSSYPRLLLKALLCCPGRQARRDALLDMLWPDAELEQAVQSLNTAVTRLRRVLVPSKGEASLLLTDEDSHVYRLAEQSLLWVDVDAALTRLGEAERCGRTSPEALSLLEETESYLSKGMILQDEEGQWAAGRRATVEQARYRTRLWLAEAYAQQQMPGQAETILSLLLEEDPTDEDVLVRLMLLLHRQGMTQQALRVYERACEAAVREEVELTGATRKLAAQLATSEKRIYLRESPTSPFSLTDEQSNSFPLFSQPDASVSTMLTKYLEHQLTKFLDIFEPGSKHLSLREIVEPDSLMTETKQFQNKTYSGSDSMQTRRQILHHLLMVGSTALVLSPYGLPYPDGTEQLHPSVFDELETITASYWRLRANASLDLLGNISEHFRTIVNLLQQSLPRKAAQQLCSLAGETAQLLGQTLFDLREYALAWSYYMLSIKAAQTASNHDLWAAGIGRMILLLIYWDHPQKALFFLQEVRQLHIQNTRVVCWLAAVEAEVHAYLGDAESCDAALKRAKKILQHEPLGEDHYATGLSASRLAGYEGACFVRLHQPDRALPALQQALSLLDPQAIRRQSTLLTDMGMAYAQQGNIQQACQLAVQALSITKQTRSRAVLERVRTLRSELEAWKETSEVHDLEKQLDTTSALIAM